MHQRSPSAQPLPEVCFRLQESTGAERIVTLAGATTDDQVQMVTSVVEQGCGDGELLVDGRVAPADALLINSGLRHGSLVQVRTTTPSSPSPGGAAERHPQRVSKLVLLTWVVGPDTGRRMTLQAGRWIVGRAPTADVRGDDTQLATHQGILTVDYDTRVTYSDIGVGRPATMNGELITDVVVVAPGDWLTVGASAFTVSPISVISPLTSGSEFSPDAGCAQVSRLLGAHPWLDVVHRPPRQLHDTTVEPVELPAIDGSNRSLASGVGIASAMTTLCGGIVMAVVLHQLMLLVMVGVGATIAIVTACVRAVRRRRGRGHSRRRTAVELDRFATALRRHRQLTEEGERATGIDGRGVTDRLCADTRLWQVRPGDHDAFIVELGTGDRRYHPRFGDGDTSLQQVADLIAACSTLRAVPIRMTLSAGSVVGVCGDRHGAVSIVRSLICQLAASSGPADWLLVALPTRDGSWEWTKWLPHFCHELHHEDDLLGICESAAAAGRRVVVITDRSAQLSTRTTSLRRAMNAATVDLSVITLADEVTALSSLCTDVVHANIDGSGTWQPLGGDGVLQRFRLIGVSEASAGRFAAGLGRFTDPELHDVDGGRLGGVDLLELLGTRATSAAAIAANWSLGNDISPLAIIGQSSSGAIEIDLERDGPHGLIAGTTGAGKSELLRTIVLALCVSSPPEQLSFVLIDYKGGAAFDRCGALPHVVGMVTDLDEHLAARVLRSLDAEVRRREHVLRDLGAADLGTYRSARSRLSRGSVEAGGRHPRVSRLVIVVDEFAAMASELPGFLTSLVSVAQRGRSLGMHLLLATQRPAGVVNDDIRANTNMRIALRVHDSSDSTDVIGDPLASTLPRRSPGRAVIRLGVDELETFQAARCTGQAPLSQQSGLRIIASRSHGQPDAGRNGDGDRDRDGDGDPCGNDHRDQHDGDLRSLDVLVERIRSADADRGVEAPHRPWLDPLPELLPRRRLGGEAIGVVDLPDDQRRGELTWSHDDGHLVIAGALGSGATTALVAVAMHACERAGPDALHMYIIDASGSTALDPLARLRHCAGVVRVSEAERRARLLDRLRQLTVIRTAADKATKAPRILLLIDGLGALRSQLLESARPDELVDLERIITDGPNAGIALAVAVENAAAIPPSLAARSASRWILRMADPAEAAALGAPRDSSPPRMVPGRGVLAGSGLEFQIGIDTEPIDELVDEINRRSDDGFIRRRNVDVDGPSLDNPATHNPATNQGPLPIDVLPTTLSFATLPPTSHFGAGVQLDFGLRSDDLTVAGLRLFDGEHAVVGGPPRAGRTTALVTLAASWQSQHRHGLLSVVAPRSIGRFTSAGLLLDHHATESPLGIIRRAMSAWPDVPTLLIVDDADLVDDAGGLLQESIASLQSGFHLIVAARLETLRAYSHWSSAVKRSRKGVLLGPLNDVDGDMLGVFLPRRATGANVAPTVGRGFLVTDAGATLIQVAEVADQLPAAGSNPGRVDACRSHVRR